MTQQDEQALRIEAINQARMGGNCCDARTLIESAERIYKWLRSGTTAQDNG